MLKTANLSLQLTILCEQALPSRWKAMLMENISVCFYFHCCFDVNSLQMEYRFLLAGGASTQAGAEIPKPADWVPGRAWGEFQQMTQLPHFADIPRQFGAIYLDDFKRIFDSIDPHRFA